MRNNQSPEDTMRTATSAQPSHQQATDLAELLGVAVATGHCDEPAAHPAWASGESCSTLLPLGGRYDALDVPWRTGAVGLGYLRLWAVPLGPVVENRDRMVFLVEPEAREDMTGLMVRDRLGDPRRGIRYRGDGHLPVPSSHTGTPAEARWVVPPAPAVVLPAAGELLGALAYAAHQLQRTEGRHAPVPRAR
jgi:hypothetical protein